MVGSVDAEDLSALVTRRVVDLQHPVVVGISGYGGSGKSTLTRQLVTEHPSWIRMRGDDFLDPVRSHRRSSNWDGVERGRLRDEVLEPFREGRASSFRRFDWSARHLSEPEPVPLGEVMIIDLIGLFHPDAFSALDLTVWCDVSLETAQARGMQRDRRLGRDHSALWTDVWVPNERDFDEGFNPRSQAEVLFR